MNYDNSVYEHLARYAETVERERGLNISDFVSEMEPIFRAGGYRNHNPNPTGTLQILLVHDGGAGDFILLSPCLREIKRLYEGAHITLAIPPHSQDLASACPYVDDLLIHEMLQPKWDFAQYVYRYNLDFAQKLLALHIDIAFNFGVFVLVLCSVI